MFNKLTSRMFRLLNKTNYLICVERYASTKAKSKDLDPFSKKETMNHC